MTRIFSLLLVTAVLISAPVLAAEEKKTDPAPAAAKEEPALKKEVTPITKWIDAENAMIDPLNDLDKESVFILRQKHSVIRVIGVVERDIDSAVKSCGKANPDMKAAIEGRFTQWKNAVDPVIATAKKNLTTEIEKQTIVNEAQFKKVLKLNDEAFEYGDKKTAKQPVSSKEACEALIESMNDTEDDMITLLQDTLLPPSVIKSRVQKQATTVKKKSFSKDTP
jgi:hypothetical protein